MAGEICIKVSKIPTVTLGMDLCNKFQELLLGLIYAKVPRVTLGKEICNHDLHKCWVIYLSYNNYTGRIYAKVKNESKPHHLLN